jgi:hypothetical protein
MQPQLLDAWNCFLINFPRIYSIPEHIWTKIAKKTEDSRKIPKHLTDGLANSVILINTAQGREVAAPKPSKFQSS